jgi:hypothetical protein
MVEGLDVIARCRRRIAASHELQQRAGDGLLRIGAPGALDGRAKDRFIGLPRTRRAAVCVARYHVGTRTGSQPGELPQKMADGRGVWPVGECRRVRRWTS